MLNYLAKFISAFAISFLVAFISTPVLRRLAVTLKIVDLPNKRKIHKKAIPLLGGMAIYLGFLTGFFFHFEELRYFLPVLIGGTIMLGVGVINDFRELSAKFRLLCQLLIALIIVNSGIRVDFLPNNFLGNLGEVLLTIFWIIGVTNAYNYLDGMDGLASGSAAINLVCFGIILFIGFQPYLCAVSIILAAACAGFLPHNFNRRKIFLGDAGSTFLGFSLACVAIMGTWAEANIVRLSIPLLILGVPIFDMIFTTIVRINQKKVVTITEWFEYAGRDHFHHYLVDLGLSPVGAVLFIYSITLSLGMSAILVTNDSPFEALFVVVQSAIIFTIIGVLMVVAKKRHSGWCRAE